MSNSKSGSGKRSTASSSDDDALPLIAVPYVLFDMKDGKTKALFGVPVELAPVMTEHPVMCRGACFYLQIDLELTQQLAGSADDEKSSGETVYLSTVFESLDPDSTAEAISKRLAVRLDDPSPMGASQIMGM